MVRTTTSAMASPSPVPPGRSSARWNRSSTRSRSDSGIPGPESSTERATCPPVFVTRSSTRPPLPVYRAGVVQEDADQPIDRVAVRPDERILPFEARDQAHRHGARDGFEAICAGFPDRRDVDRSCCLTIGPVEVVRAGQPEEVLDDGAEASTLGGDPSKSRLVARRVTSTAQCEIDLGLDDAQRCAELVGGVGGELGLAPSDLLDGCGRARVRRRTNRRRSRAKAALRGVPPRRAARYEPGRALRRSPRRPTIHPGSAQLAAGRCCRPSKV